MVPSPDDLTPAEVARRTGRPLKTVQEWLRRGRLRGYKQGPKFWRVPEAALDELCRPNDALASPPTTRQRRQQASAARRQREDEQLKELGMLA